MAVVLKYTQSTYDAKITELEGYLSQLQDHYDRLEALKADMYNFWNDDNSIKAGEALTTTMRQVNNAMQRTTDMLNFYRNSVSKLSGASSTVSGALEDALGVLGNLGI